MSTRNDLSIYDDVADAWWSEEIRWVRTLRRMVKGRLSWFDRLVDWQGKEVLEHVQDLQQVAAEMARVLRPGGLLCFDTINRNLLARIATITIAEDLLRLLPTGTHDPDLFIRPDELRETLESHGLEMGRIVGLGPRGVNTRLDLSFGRVPTTAIIYLRQLLQVAQRRVAGTEIVNGYADAGTAQSVQHAYHRIDVTHDHTLGHFELEALCRHSVAVDRVEHEIDERVALEL